VNGGNIDYSYEREWMWMKERQWRWSLAEWWWHLLLLEGKLWCSEQHVSEGHSHSVKHRRDLSEQQNKASALTNC